MGRSSLSGAIKSDPNADAFSFDPVLKKFKQKGPEGLSEAEQEELGRRYAKNTVKNPFTPNQKSEAELQDEMNAQMEAMAKEQLDIARSALEEQKAYNNWLREQAATEKAARDKEIADAEANAKVEEERLKNRGRRRLTLVNTDQQDENVLGNVSIGRSKLLGN